MSLLGSAAHVLRREGLASLLTKTIKKVVRPAIEVNRFHFFEAELAAPRGAPEPRVAVELRTGTARDLETFADVFAIEGHDPERLRGNLARGETLVLGFVGDDLVHYSWTAFSTAWIDEIGVTLKLGPGESYGYDAFTIRQWRGRGIQPAASAFKTALERSRGYTRHISYARADNRPALRTMQKLGRKRTRTVWQVSLFGMKRPLLFGAGREGSPSLIVDNRRQPRAPGRAQHRPTGGSRPATGAARRGTG
ncbi:MAG: hypothetical protein R3344_00480 [Acidobacteriota bacterium]|nr:hypothetical protein [Acidobacteriota bacterium]